MDWKVIVFIIFVGVYFWAHMRHIDKRFDRLEEQRDKDRDFWDQRYDKLTETASDWLKREFSEVKEKVGDLLWMYKKDNPRPDEDIS